MAKEFAVTLQGSGMAALDRLKKSQSIQTTRWRASRLSSLKAVTVDEVRRRSSGRTT